MKKLLIRPMKTIPAWFLLCGLFFLLPARAQYPSIPPEDRRAAQELIDKAQAHSDSAWQVALPVIRAEHAKGKSYVPWASRPADLPQAKIPAFPGAEGGGMYSFGGRGGKVLTVTNLNDDGIGSLRWACEQGGARTIVFNVSGYIRLKSPLIIRAPYITIAGQTAPGEGVCIIGESVWIDTHDVVIRYLRIRRGETWVGRCDDCLGGNPVGNIMLDHLSVAFGLDENISFYRHMFTNDAKKPVAVKLPTVNVTIQNSIIAKALDTFNHGFGSIIGGENASFMRNLWTCNNGRNPRVGSESIFNFVNNVMFNWYGRTLDGGMYSTKFNICNNYYKPGPATPKDKPISHRIVRLDGERDKNGFLEISPTYCEGNIVDGNQTVSTDNWKGGVQLGSREMTDEIEQMIRRHEPFEHPFFTVMPAQQAYEYVLKDAGATLPCRDKMDEIFIEEVKTGKAYYAKDARPDSYLFKHRRLPQDSWKIGIITDVQQIGGFPEYKKWKPYKDSDLDGMPDDWEKANGLNPHDASDANQDMTGDGYTNIEKYINGIPSGKRTD